MFSKAFCIKHSNNTVNSSCLFEKVTSYVSLVSFSLLKKQQRIKKSD